MSLMVGGSYERTTGFGAGNLMYTDADTFGWPLDYLNPVHPPRSEWEFFRFGGNDYNLGVTGFFGQWGVEPTDRLMLTAGGRYDRLDLENTLTFRGRRPGGGGQLRRLQSETRRDREAAARRRPRQREPLRAVLRGVPAAAPVRAACVPATTRSNSIRRTSTTSR